MNTLSDVYILRGPGVNEDFAQKTSKTLKKHITNPVIEIDYSYLNSKLTSSPKAVLVVGGGNAAYQREKLEVEKTYKKISDFVISGNSYLGICAGSYLACLPLLDLVTVRYEPKTTGFANQKLRIRTLLTTFNLDLPVQITPVIYFGGPEFMIKDWSTNVLAYYNDLEDKINKPAVIEEYRGRGKVLLTSHHWELSADFMFDKFKDFYHLSLNPADLLQVIENSQQSNHLMTRLFLSRLNLNISINEINNSLEKLITY